jgi:Tfp pilus assembly protein PilF
MSNGDGGESVSHAVFVAERMLQSGNAQSALSAVRDALGRDPQSTDGLALLARCHASLKQWGEADEALATLAAVDPEDFRVVLFKAAFADKGGAVGKRSIAAADEVLARDPENAFAFNLKGIGFENAGKYVEAERCYRRAIEIDPEDADYLASFADFLGKTGRKAEAAKLLEEAAEIAPDNTSVLVASGTKDLREGRIDQAYDKAIWALQQDANDQAALTLLVSIKTKRSPVMGIWWRWASFMESMSTGMRWGVIIGLYIAWQVLNRTVIRTMPDAVQIAAVVAWLSFCVLTWVGPSIFRRAIRKELAAVKVGKF